MSYLEEERLAQEIKDKLYEDDSPNDIKTPVISHANTDLDERQKARYSFIAEPSTVNDSQTERNAKEKGGQPEIPANDGERKTTDSLSGEIYVGDFDEIEEPLSKIGNYSDIERTMPLPYGKKLLNESLENKSTFNAFFRDSFAYNLMVTADKRYEYAGKDPKFNLSVALEEAGIPEDSTGAYEWCENRNAFDFQQRLMQTREGDKRVREEAGFLTGVGYRIFFGATTDAPVTLSLLLGSTAVGTPVATAFAWAGVPATLAGLTIASLEGAVFSGAENLLKKTVNENETYGEVWDRTKTGALTGLFFSSIPVVGKFGISQARRVAVINKFFDKVHANWEIGKFNFELGTFHTENSVYRMEQLNRCYESAFKWTPLGRCATSKSATLNKLGLMSFRSDYATAYAKAGEDVFPSIVTLKELHNNKLLILKSDYLDIKKDFLKSESAKENNVTFEGEVRKCIWNNGKHESQEVVEAATLLNNYKNNKMREAHEHGVFDGVFSNEVEQVYLTKDEALLSEEGLLAKLMTGDTSHQAVWYFPRVYDKRAVIVDSNGIKELLKKGKIKEKHLEEAKQLTEDQLEEYANATYNTITGVNKNSDYISSVPRVSSDKSRTVLIHDEVLEPYLLNDPLKIIEALHNDLSPAIQINKTLKAYGMKEWNDFHTMIDKEFHEAKKLITKESESIKLHEQFAKDKAFINDVHELMMGSYGSRIDNPTLATWVDSSLQLVYAARMGPLLLTSLGDLSHLHAEYGALAPMGKGIVHFVKNVGQGIANAVKGGVNFMVRANLKKGLTKHEKAIGEELHIMGVAMDSAAARIRSRLGSEMPQPDHMNADWFTRNINKGMRGLADGVTKLTGIHHWDDAMRTIIAQLHGHELLGICKDSLTRELTHAERYFLSKNRIPVSSAKEIGQRFEAHGGEFEKMRVANSHRWANDAITEQYQASILAKTRIVMPLPGAGDAPLWANNSVVGRLATQFKSYGFKHYSELVRRMCSDETPALRKFTAVALATSLNYLSTLLKSAASGDAYDWDDPQLLKDSMIKNLYMIDNALRFTDDLEYSVKRHGAPIGTIGSVSKLSPVVGYLSDAVNTAGQARKERPFSERELKTIWNMIPFMTLPYVNPIKSRLIQKYIEGSGGEQSLTKHERRIEREFAE